jgi:hypothetical protein
MKEWTVQQENRAKKKKQKSKKQGRQTQKKKTDSYREILLPQREGTSSAMFGLDAHQTQLFLEFFFHAFTLICPLSKMTAFLVIQMTQQAVMHISLKRLLPKLLLASITISR